MELVEDFSDICSLPNIAVCLPESLHQQRDRAVLQLVHWVASPCTLARGGGGGCEEAGGDLEGATQAVGWVEVTGNGMEDISRGMEAAGKCCGSMEVTGK